MDNFIAVMNGVNAISITVRILLAALFGGIIGFERETRRSPAGLRTFTLVAIGAALLVLLNMYIYELYPSSKTDVGRIAAAAVSGIGFLGAGTIIVTRDQQVKGLTTAAELWATAAIGLALGAGFYLAAAVSTLVILLIVICFRPIDVYLMENSRTIVVYLEIPEKENPYRIFQTPETEGITLSSCSRQQVSPQTEGDQTYLATLVLKRGKSHQSVIADLLKISNIHYICEVPK